MLALLALFFKKEKSGHFLPWRRCCSARANRNICLGHVFTLNYEAKIEDLLEVSALTFERQDQLCFFLLLKLKVSKIYKHGHTFIPFLVSLPGILHKHASTPKTEIVTLFPHCFALNLKFMSELLPICCWHPNVCLFYIMVQGNWIILSSIWRMWRIGWR